jgi:hypothetical protein
VKLLSAGDFALCQFCDESLRFESVELHLLVSVELHPLLSAELHPLLSTELHPLLSVELHPLLSVEFHLLVSVELRLLLSVELNKQALADYYWPPARVVHVGLMELKLMIQKLYQAMEIVEQPLLSRAF